MQSVPFEGGGVGETELLGVPRDVESQGLQSLGELDGGGLPLKEGDGHLGRQGVFERDRMDGGAEPEVFDDPLVDLSVLPVVLDAGVVGLLGAVPEGALVGANEGHV